MDRETRTTIAVREARDFKKKLANHFLGSLITMLIVLMIMAYFDVATKWIMIAGFWLSTGAICYLIEECAMHLDAGRSYLEMWAVDAEETLSRIENKIDAISPSWRK